MSMLCQLCQEAKASVHITDTIPEKRERHLCEECAEKEGVIIKQTQHTTPEILQEFIKQKANLDAADDRSCPKCGLTFREFRLKGRLGCPHDYEIFGPFLMPLIERAHGGNTSHVGKVPQTASAGVKKHTTMLRIRRELADAVANEDFEKAAQLRDEIRAIETSNPI